MCSPMVAIGLTAASGIYTAKNQYQEGVNQEAYYNSVASQKEQEGQALLSRADQQSTMVQDQAAREGKNLKENQARFNSQQRAAVAANGLQGSAAEDIVNDSFSRQRMDELALRYNADVKSYEINSDARFNDWQARNEANQYRYAGKTARRAGKTNSFSTLLGTAATVAKYTSDYARLK